MAFVGPVEDEDTDGGCDGDIESCFCDADSAAEVMSTSIARSVSRVLLSGLLEARGVFGGGHGGRLERGKWLAAQYSPHQHRKGREGRRVRIESSWDGERVDRPVCYSTMGLIGLSHTTVPPPG